jgi:hypothetical protein
MTEEMGLFFLALLLAGIYSHRTGWGTGGVVTPGFLALHAARPLFLAGMLGLGVLLALLLEVLVRRFSFFGRERLTVALVLSVGALGTLGALFAVPLPWYGWVIPGLVAADCQRQGALGTLGGALACGGAALCARALLP